MTEKNNKRTTFYIDKSLHKKAKMLALTKDESLTAVINRLLKLWIKNKGEV